MSVKDSSCPDRPTEIDTDEIKVQVDENSYLTARDIAGDFQNSHKSVLSHIRKIDYVSRLDARRTAICNLLIRREKNHLFLSSLVTVDEKYIVYNNLKRKMPWGSPSDPPNVTLRADIHQKKAMLSIWWG